MNSEVYVNGLNNRMLPTLWQQFGVGPFPYQQENAPVHEAKFTASSFEKNQVDGLHEPHRTSLG